MENKQITKIKEIFRELTSFIEKEGFYSDFNFFESFEKRIFVDKENVDVSKDSSRGVKIRLWDGEKFLESALTSLEKSEIEKKVMGLLKIAKNNQNLIENKVELFIDKEIIEKDFGIEVIDDKGNLEEKVELLKGFRDKIVSYSKDIATAKTVLGEERENHVFVNPYKCLFQSIPLNFFAMVAYVNSDDGVKMVYESFVANESESLLKKAESGFDLFFEKIENYKKAKKLEGGKYRVVLSPHLSGLLAHESFGHGMESDTMLRGRALASDWAGKKIAPEYVSIVDYGQVEGKNGQFYFDHEGNVAKKTYLVKNGVICEPMSDVYSATKLGIELSGNSRFERFDHKNYVRMSNTYFEAGDKTFDELISKVEDGIFIRDSMGGMEDPKGWGVQLQGCFGQRILNGKLVDEFYEGFSLTGFLPDIMKSIEGVGDTIEIEGGGSCGKGHKEWVRVSEGGPYMLVGGVILG